MARVDLAGVVGRYHNGGMIVPHRVSGHANQGGTAGALVHFWLSSLGRELLVYEELEN